MANDAKKVLNSISKLIEKPDSILSVKTYPDQFNQYYTMTFVLNSSKIHYSFELLDYGLETERVELDAMVDEFVFAYKMTICDPEQVEKLMQLFRFAELQPNKLMYITNLRRLEAGKVWTALCGQLDCR